MRNSSFQYWFNLWETFFTEVIKHIEFGYLGTYLKRPENQVENEPELRLHLLWDECKHNEIDPKQRNQKQRGLCQSPETRTEKTEQIQISTVEPMLDLSLHLPIMKCNSGVLYIFYIWGAEMEQKPPLKMWVEK